MGPFAVTWSELLISIQTAVILFPVNLVVGRLFPLIQPQEPLPLFPPIQTSCLSDASFEPLSVSEVVEVSLAWNFTGKLPASLPCVLEKTSEADLLEGCQVLLTLLAVPCFLSPDLSFLLTVMCSED